MAWSAEWDANGSSLSSTDGKTCRTWMSDGEGTWFCTDVFQEVGVRGGGGGGGGGGSGDRKMVKAGRQEEAVPGAAIPASPAVAPLQTELLGD